VTPKHTARSLEYWHSAFGHIGYSSLFKMIKNAAVYGMNVAESATRVVPQCIACIKGKFRRSAFPAADRPTEPLQQVHADVSGPHPEALNQHKYVCILRDKFTGYTMTRTMAEKSDSAAFIKYAISYLERNTPYKVKHFRTDGGGEFLGEELKSWLNDRGIHHGVTAPESSASNGVAERVILTLFDRVRAILVETNQPRILWSYIIGHVTHGMNYVPFSEQSVSPHEMMFGEKPNVSHLIPFGTKVAAWVPQQSRKDKLEPRGEVGRLVGYHPESTSMYQVSTVG